MKASHKHLTAWGPKKAAYDLLDIDYQIHALVPRFKGLCKDSTWLMNDSTWLMNYSTQLMNGRATKCITTLIMLRVHRRL